MDQLICASLSHTQHYWYEMSMLEVSAVISEKTTRVDFSNYLENYYWPCGGGLSTMSAIGTQLCDLINSGLTRYDGGLRFK